MEGIIQRVGIIHRRGIIDPRFGIIQRGGLISDGGGSGPVFDLTLSAPDGAYAEAPAIVTGGTPIVYMVGEYAPITAGDGEIITPYMFIINGVEMGEWFESPTTFPGPDVMIEGSTVQVKDALGRLSNILIALDPLTGISGIIQRFRFKDIPGDPGDDITSWENIGSYGGFATQGVSSLGPTLGVDAVEFDGIQDFMMLPALAGTGLTELSLFILVRNNEDPPTVENSAGPWVGGIGNYPFSSHTPYTDGTILDAFATDDRKNVGNPVSSLTQWSIYEASSKNGYWRAWLNGSALIPAISSNVFGLGASPSIAGDGSYRWGGRIIEIILINRASDTLDGDREFIRSYVVTQIPV